MALTYDQATETKRQELARKLWEREGGARGGKCDKDFSGLCIWARTCSGQANLDCVMQEIAAEVFGG